MKIKSLCEIFMALLFFTIVATHPCAAEGKKTVVLKVMTINVRHNLDFWEERFPLVADEIARLKPDLIGLQEVQVGIGQSRTLLGLIKERMEPGWPEYGVYEQLKTGFDGLVGEGIAIFSNLPMEAKSFTDLGFGRTALFNRVNVAEGLTVDFYNTHLHHRGGDEARLPQAEKILKYMKKKDAGLITFLAGDLNTRPDEKPVMLLLENSFADTYADFHAGEEPGYTSPIALSKDGATQNPSNRIDYVIVRVPPGLEGAVKILDSVVCFENFNDDGLYPSDHLGVMTTFEISY